MYSNVTFDRKIEKVDTAFHVSNTNSLTESKMLIFQGRKDICKCRYSEIYGISIVRMVEEEHKDS